MTFQSYFLSCFFSNVSIYYTTITTTPSTTSSSFLLLYLRSPLRKHMAKHIRAKTTMGT